MDKIIVLILASDLIEKYLNFQITSFFWFVRLRDGIKIVPTTWGKFAPKVFG